MNRAYEDEESRGLAARLGLQPMMPPKRNRITPWEYDRTRYRWCNKVERWFRRLKGFRRVFSHFDNLDILFLRFVVFALIMDALRNVNNI